MATPPIEAPGATPDDEPRAAAGGHRRIRLAVWSVLSAALLLFIVFGSVSAVSYRYYSFSGRVARLDPHRSLIDIWRDSVAALPSFTIGWLPGTVIVVCLAMSVTCAIAGAWMLLMQGEPETPRRASRAG